MQDYNGMLIGRVCVCQIFVEMPGLFRNVNLTTSPKVLAALARLCKKVFAGPRNRLKVTAPYAKLPIGLMCSFYQKGVRRYAMG